MRTFLIVPSILIVFVASASAQVERLPEGTPLPPYAKKIHLDRGGDLTPFDIKKSSSGLPAIMITGYWPPTNEMIRHFSTDPVQNPGGWKGGNWEGRGFDVYSFFPEFPHGLGKGEGDFEVDYQDTSQDFWLITSQINPRAVITFGLAYNNNDWELEWRNRNLTMSQWVNDYLSPYKPTPAPPDAFAPPDYIRYSSLPMDQIVDAVNAAVPSVNAFGDYQGDSGNFLCEFVGYHASWYHDQHCFPGNPNQNIGGGHIHVGGSISLPDCVAATEETIRALIDSLTDSLVPNDRIIRESEGGAISLMLDGGASNAYRTYLLLGSASGTFPGIPLPGGMATLPVNWDLFSNIVLGMLNTPVFDNFMGVLDVSGTGSATFDTLGPLSPGTAGLTLSFAYALNKPWDFASNPVDVRIVP